MSTLIDKWHKLKKSGHFHRNWKTNKVMKQGLKKEFKLHNTQGKSCSDSICRINLEHQLTTNLETLNDSLETCCERENLPLNEIETSNEEHMIHDSIILKMNNDEFTTDLHKWATMFHIKHNAMKVLMRIITNKFNIFLPVDPRTFMQTPAKPLLWKIGEGQYWHQGLKVCLEKVFSYINVPNQISINVNIDGLPLHRSSKDEFWPILFNITELPKLEPMIIGIYWGKGKPSNVDGFLNHFVEEVNEILTEGIAGINSQQKVVKIRSFICDSPARALIKGVAYFNSQNGCQKCTITGEYSYVSHTNYFPVRICEKRTDHGFRQMQYGSHHKTNSPLLALPIDMIQDFPVGDSLHLLDLGIMKRLLCGWRDGSFGNYKTKWLARVTQEISHFLVQIKLPAEFHRKIRGLDVLAFWKGLEFRTFFYYVGIVVLKHYLSTEVYEHFLMLFCAVTICSSEEYKSKLNVAQTLLEHFVEYFVDIYGEHFITSNVHNLLHLVDDVKRFGILTTFSTYPFESKLFAIKNIIRSGHRPLAQIAKRLGEMGKVEVQYINKDVHANFPILKKMTEKKQGIHTKNENDLYFTHIQLDGFILESQGENQWFLSSNREIVSLKYIIKSPNNDIIICGNILKMKDDLFATPVCSSYFNIYKSNCVEDEIKAFKTENIKCKLVAVKDLMDNVTIFFPLLHTL